MRITFYILTFVFAFSTVSVAQNYFQEYPISVSIGSNGTQSRLQCATYDSVLQTTVTYNTVWRTELHIIQSNSFGKLGYSLWTTPVAQMPLVGFIIYDYNLHQFVEKQVPVALQQDTDIGVICKQIWVSIVHFYNQTGWVYVSHYRYDIHDHLWYEFWTEYQTNFATIGNFLALGNTDFFYESNNEYEFHFIDPVKNTIIRQHLVNDILVFRDDYGYGYDDNNHDQYNYFTYDPVKSEYCKYPRANLTEGAARGIYYAKDTTDLNKHFFFIYDQGVQDWVTDSVYSPLITSITAKEGVVAYFDSIPGIAKKVHCLVYNPLLHQWIRDSITVNGAATGLHIVNGTVKWGDANGLNIRGYDQVTGWGNYNTTLLMHFAFEDYSSEGAPVIFVRNYSIGTEKIYYDFGDGIQSLDNRHVLWHSYKNSGTYNICIVDSATGQNSCQPITFNICGNVGTAMASDSVLCEGDSVELSLTSFNGNIQWQRKYGNNWIDEILPGATSQQYFVSPDSTAEYRAKVQLAGCLPSISNALKVVFEPATSNYILSDTLVNKCSGISFWLKVVGSNAAIYTWQRDIGSGWTTVGNSTATYLANMAASYRVIQSSGVCFRDTSKTILVIETPKAPLPTVVPGFTCGPDTVNLSISSPGIAHWYDMNGNSLNYVGNPYSTYVSTTTNFKVKVSDGYQTEAGLTDTSGGSTVTFDGNDIFGQRLYSSIPVRITSFDLFAATSGTIVIIFYNSITNAFLGNGVATIIPGANTIKLDFYLPGNVLVDFKISGNVTLIGNTSGFVYPISIPGSPLTITGYVDSAFHSTPDFYNMYNIKITTGCLSSEKNCPATVYPPISNPAVVPNGLVPWFCQGDSLKLIGYPLGSTSYLWYKNGISTGYTGANYTVKLPGNYSVLVSSSNCSATSPLKRITVPCIQPLNPQDKTENLTFDGDEFSVSAFFNSNGNLELDSESDVQKQITISIVDITGKQLYNSQLVIDEGITSTQISTTNLASGIYIIRMSGGNKAITIKAVKSW